MSLLAQPVDYTDKDFDSLRARLYNLISSVFPNWTDDNVANFGNILIELLAFNGDVLTKYQDAQARETRWTQATVRKSILSLVKLINYSPTGVQAAQAQETFTLSEAAAFDVTIPAGTTVAPITSAAPAYQLLAPLVIPAGQLSEVATVENSVSQTDTFSSTGLPNQSFTLTESPYIDASLEIVATDGTYTQVPNFLNSTGTSQNFTVSTDSNDVATFSFGNGINGSIPQGTIAASYKSGGGLAGRVDANQLQVLNGSFEDGGGNPVSIAVNNAGPSSGGFDSQPVAQIQQLAPLSLRTLTRSIARDDFENVALQVPGVARALFTTSNEDPGVLENRGILYVVPPGAGTPSPSLLAAVLAAFTSLPYPTCFRIVTQKANYLQVSIVARLFKTAGTLPAVLKANALLTLFSLFTDTIGPTTVFLANGSRWVASVAAPQNPDAGKPNPLINFGYYLQDEDGNPEGLFDWSDVFAALAGTPGVRKVGAGAADLLINGIRADLPIAVNQFPILASVQIIDGDTGTTL